MKKRTYTILVTILIFCHFLNFYRYFVKFTVSNIPFCTSYYGYFFPSSDHVDFQLSDAIECFQVIKQSDAKRKVSSVVREGAWAGSGGRYTRATRTADWSAPETVRFYRALAAIGTDFTLMPPLFPGRNRRDLKLKVYFFMITW